MKKKKTTFSKTTCANCNTTINIEAHPKHGFLDIIEGYIVCEECMNDLRTIRKVREWMTER